MTTPPPGIEPGNPSGDSWCLLRGELHRLADHLVDASPADRPALRLRVSHAVDTQRRFGIEDLALSRLLHHMLSDLSGEADAIDTLYYARQLVVQTERLPN